MSELVNLGRTYLQVSRVCFGCWQMGGSSTFWGRADQKILINSVHKALDVGVNFFDTADAYGDGHSEKMLGKALKGVARDRFVLATKVYWRCLEKGGSERVGDLSHDYIVWECEQSLKRLGLEYIDLYQAHFFDQITHLAETVGAFEKLRKDGKIRYFGCSNFTVEQLRAALGFGEFDTVQPRYNLLDRGIEKDILPLCMSENLGVLVYSPLQFGLLTGKFAGSETFTDLRARNSHFQGDQFKTNVDKINQLKPIAKRLGKTVTQLSLRMLLEHPAVHCVIVGIKKPEHIQEASGAMGWELGRKDYYRIRDILV